MENQYFSRWYDKDSVLSMSMRTLSTSNDVKQIEIALNIIKVIIEHNIKDHKYESVEDIMNAVEEGRIQKGYSRWYDIDATVRTAIQMLEKCDPETKKKVALDMAQIVIEKIIQDDDINDAGDETMKDDFELAEFEGKIIDIDLDKTLKQEDE